MDTREAELVVAVKEAQVRRREAYEKGGLTFFQEWEIEHDLADAKDALRRYSEAKG